MGSLVAKTKGKKGIIYKILKTNIQLIQDSIKGLSTVDFNPNYKLEDDEIYRIQNFSKTDYCSTFLTGSFSSTNYNQIKVSDYQKLDYLCFVKSNKYCFQKFSKTTQLLQKSFFELSNQPQLVTKKKIIIVNNNFDAYYNKNQDCLYFINFVKAKNIFKKLENLYREATNKEVNQFLSKSFVELKHNYSSEKVKTANRKRIAIAMDTWKNFDKIEKKAIVVYIKKYCKHVPCTKKAFQISTEEHLKQVLFGIEQRYYTTLIGEEKRLANSILQID